MMAEINVFSVSSEMLQVTGVDDNSIQAWVGLSKVQCLIKHIIGHIGDGILLVKLTNQECRSTEEDRVLRTRLQSHQVHLTVLH